MRYDRMIATILALPTAGEGAQTVAWRQLVDIVAQAGDRLDPAMRMRAHERIAALRPSVAASERRNAAASLAARATPEAVAIFAVDEPAVAAPVLARAALDDARWLALLPSLPATSRTILRNRRDLSPAVERALASFGASDFALPPAAPPLPESDGSQIRNLVARIEAFRSQQPQPPVAPPVAAPAAAEPVSSFAFETSVDGAIDWVDAAPRGALIGVSIAEAALPRTAGVDGQAAGAFRRRAPFHDARLAVAGEGAASGDWLIAAQPLFDPLNGRFVGYRGTARRPRADERAHAMIATGEGLAPDSLRQLVHELRTPLNAIQGFAQMIEQQMLGPAATAYRGHARSIVDESARLLDVVEDLDAAARLDSDRFETGEGVCNLAGAIAAVVHRLAGPLAARGVTLAVDAAATVDVAVARAQGERLIHRLLSMATGLAEPGEQIAVRGVAAGARALLSVARPAALAGRDAAALHDPGFGPEGEWPTAPLLGLGFSLRLITNLARAGGGSFEVEDDAFVLSLPRAGVDAGRAGEGA